MKITPQKCNDNFSDRNVEKMTVVEQTLPTILNNFQSDSKISGNQDSTSMKTDCSDQTLSDN